MTELELFVNPNAPTGPTKAPLRRDSFATVSHLRFGDYAISGFAEYRMVPTNHAGFSAQLAELREEVRSLREQIQALEAMLVVDEMDWDEALAGARSYFEGAEGGVDAEQLATVLGTSVGQAADVLEALEREGVVAVKGAR